MAVPKNERLNITLQQKKYLLKKLGIKNIIDIDTAILKQLKENLESLKTLDNNQKSLISYGI